MLHIINFLQSFKRDEKGQALTEYGLIIALVGIVVILGLGYLATDLNTLFDGIGDNF
ncbi:MAG: pilus assembly protein [Gracilibacter sp. BRH_c7a]|nr:MAG: pilus assembly protein [Gracilibacter sp. BRH_c7a]